MRHINLIPPQYLAIRTSRRKAAQWRLQLIGAGAFFALWGICAVIHLSYLNGRIDQLQAQKHELDTAIKTHAAQMTDYAGLSHQLNIIEHYRSPAPVVAILSTLSEALPDDSALNSLTIGTLSQTSGSNTLKKGAVFNVIRDSLDINFSAITTSNAGAPTAVRQLSTATLFDNIRLEEAHPVNMFGHDIHEYRISMNTTVNSADAFTLGNMTASAEQSKP